MSAHFEVVQTDAEQPWHVRIVADNGEPVLTSENLERKGDAERVLLILAETFGALDPGIVRGTTESYVLGLKRAVPVVYVDERTTPKRGAK